MSPDILVKVPVMFNVLAGLTFCRRDGKSRDGQAFRDSRRETCPDIKFWDQDLKIGLKFYFLFFNPPIYSHSHDRSADSGQAESH